MSEKVDPPIAIMTAAGDGLLVEVTDDGDGIVELFAGGRYVLDANAECHLVKKY